MTSAMAAILVICLIAMVAKVLIPAPRVERCYTCLSSEDVSHCVECETPFCSDCVNACTGCKVSVCELCAHIEPVTNNRWCFDCVQRATEE